MKEIENIEMYAYAGLRRYLFYTGEPDGRKSFEGLSKLVKEATGEAPKLDEAYIFRIKNHSHVKILMKTEDGITIHEHHGDHAAAICRICMGVIN